MRFGNLLKKELSELITVQAIFSMVFVFVILAAMGQIMGNVMEESFDTSTITVCNKDDSEFTETVLSKIEADSSVTVNYVDIQSDDYYSELTRLEIKNAVIIPKGYGESIISSNEPADIIFVSKISAGGMASSMSSISSSSMIESIQAYSADEILLRSYGLSDEEIAKVNSPVNLVEYTSANGKSVRISASSLQSVMMMQSMIAPMVIFFLLMMASQMIMTAISTEKIDKTLETLLSTPVSRLSVLMAKMVAAVISALMNAVVMMLGFIIYITGMMGSLTEELADTSASISGADVSVSVVQAMSELGMSLSPSGYILFGLQLFFTVAIGLAISLILGAMVTDVKSVQTLMLPIMVFVMLPFFVTMFTDVNEMSIMFKIIMYIIPFTHSFTALTNLMNGDMLLFAGGLIYQMIFFAICMFLAVRMFTTDKLFTMSAASGTKKEQSAFGKKNVSAPDEE